MVTDKNILDLQKEVHNQLKESTEKFAYYIIALCVSCLGFSVYQTKDAVIDYSKIILMLAVFLWLFSIYFGIGFIKKQQYGLLLSYRIYDNQRNKFEPSKDSPENMKMADELFKEKIEKVSKQSKLQYKLQLNTFFIGVIIYIIWHIFQMYLNTIR